MNHEALKDLLYKMADDLLIIGHRNSEWTGIGPMLEEDIAFSSMAQDKIGQSLEFYKMLHALGESDPDTLAFMRNTEQFHNCQLVELPIGEYDFSLIRHFLFDYSCFLRYEMLSESNFEQLAQAATKFKGELKYHILHAQTWIEQLGNSDDAVSRLQQSLEQALPYALGIFEASKYENEIKQERIFAGEAELQQKWQQQITDIISKTKLNLPNLNDIEPVNGGRYGKHTEHLQPLLDEMSEVFKVDPTADW